MARPRSRIRAKAPAVRADAPAGPTPRGPREAAGVSSVRSVQRAARIITALAEDPYPIGIVALAGRASLSASSAHRILATLTALGWVEQNSRSAKYRLSHRMLGIGVSGLVANPVLQDGVAYLARLAEATGCDALLSTLVGTRTVHLARVAGARTRRAQFDPGLSHPAHAMADGKLLLAYLPEEERNYIYGIAHLIRFTPDTVVGHDELERELEAIRAQGYAVEENERFEDGCGLAVPVLGADGKPVLAMLCVGDLNLNPDRTLALVHQMRSLCGELCEQLIQSGHLPGRARA
jgi:DNA-binding IclR family transcriptional regulator